MNKLNLIYEKIEENDYTHIDFIKLENNCLKIEGYMLLPGDTNVSEIFFKINGHECKAELFDRSQVIPTLNKSISQAVAFKGKIFLDKFVKKYKISIYCRTNGGLVIEKKNLNFGHFAPIGREIKNAYWHKNGYILKTNGNELYIKKCRILMRLTSEAKFLYSLSKKRKKHAFIAIAVRCVRNFIKPFIRKDIWLVSDRADKADDNGEAFFRYMSENKDKKLKCYFAIKKNFIDIERLGKYGNVITFAGWQYKFYMILGAFTVSSHDYAYPDIFGINAIFYRDLLYDTKFIFLQHGVIKDDLSELFNKYNKNFDIFVTTTRQEYKSILEYKYFYTKKQVKLTGLPRYDLLYDNSKKYITIMPTWRSYLVRRSDNGKSWQLQENFLESDYYKFYKSFLNNKKLFSEAQRFGYTICFVSHPNMQEELNLLKKIKSVIFFDAKKPYRDIFAESDMIVTDYSSVAFDFAYLRKPLIYCQFDSEKFTSGLHTYTQGYFEYECDGLGEVETTLEATVSRLIEYMENGCKLKDKYRERIDSTFIFSDKNNCERVYNAIKELK